MNKLKKTFCLSLIIICAFSLFGCKEDGKYEEVGTSSKNNEESYTFSYNNQVVSIGDNWSDVQKKLGEYNSTFVAESCAYQGTDRYYYYNDFEIMTSEIDGKELLTDIFVNKENVPATNGVCVGMGLSDMAAKMGPANKTTENTYIYYGENVNVQINTKDDKVISIEYYYVQE